MTRTSQMIATMMWKFTMYISVSSTLLIPDNVYELLGPNAMEKLSRYSIMLAEGRIGEKNYLEVSTGLTCFDRRTSTSRTNNMWWL